jgi:hypothetical protein
MKSATMRVEPQPKEFASIKRVREREEADAEVTARRVEALLCEVSFDSSMKIRGGEMPEDPDRHVDEEDPAPADVLGDAAADERPDRERHRRDTGPDPDRQSRAAAAGTWR